MTLYLIFFLVEFTCFGLGYITSIVAPSSISQLSAVVVILRFFFFFWKKLEEKNINFLNLATLYLVV